MNHEDAGVGDARFHRKNELNNISERLVRLYQIEELIRRKAFEASEEGGDAELEFFDFLPTIRTIRAQYLEDDFLYGMVLSIEEALNHYTLIEAQQILQTLNEAIREKGIS